MNHHKLLVILLVATALGATACGGDTAGKAAVTAQAASVSPAPAAKSVSRGGPAKTANAQEELPPVLTVPDGYRYEPRGRRDPFLNPIPKSTTAAKETQVIPRPDGMRGMLVEETKVTGIVTSRQPGMTKAIVTSGRQTYFAVKGDAFWDGVVKEIRPDGVVFTMISPVTKQPINRETMLPTGNSATSGR